MSNLTLTSKPIGPIGYGLMGLTWRATPPSQSQSFDAMSTALSRGANFWNGGELYGTADRNSMHLLNEYFTEHPEHAEQVVLSVKGGMVPGKMAVDGGEENVRRSVEECVKVLDGKKKIDIFECARVDPKVDIEETLRVLKALKDEGKIGGVGISEVSAATIERAAKVCEIAAVEVELSLWSTDVLRNGIAKTCQKLGIPIVAYSPLSRGALTGQGIRKNADIPDDDHRKHMPKFQDDVLEHNNKITDEVEKLAKKKGVTNAQIAIAWVRGLNGRTFKTPEGEDVEVGTVIPIPGATTSERVKENTELVDLDDGEMEEIARILAQNPVKGDRYQKEVMALSEA